MAVCVGRSFGNAIICNGGGGGGDGSGGGGGGGDGGDGALCGHLRICRRNH